MSLPAGYSSCVLAACELHSLTTSSRLLLCPWPPSRPQDLLPADPLLSNSELQTVPLDRLTTRLTESSNWISLYSFRVDQNRKHRFQQFLYCCVCRSAHSHVTLTEPLPSNGHVCRAIALAAAICWFHNSGFHQTCCNIYTVQCGGQDVTLWHPCLYIPWRGHFTFNQDWIFFQKQKS
jgi:hypothetical protein